ncbi:hypothetical protein Trydic_g4557 [Trypoxylus dichotomus]
MGESPLQPKCKKLRRREVKGTTKTTMARIKAKTDIRNDAKLNSSSRFENRREYMGILRSGHLGVCHYGICVTVSRTVHLEEQVANEKQEQEWA